MGRWFSPGTPLSSTNKTDLHDILENMNNNEPLNYFSVFFFLYAAELFEHKLG